MFYLSAGTQNTTEDTVTAYQMNPATKATLTALENMITNSPTGGEKIRATFVRDAFFKGTK
jgi:hypothetical protein